MLQAPLPRWIREVHQEAEAAEDLPVEAAAEAFLAAVLAAEAAEAGNAVLEILRK